MPRLILAAASFSLERPEQARAAIQDAIRVRPNLTLANVRHIIGPRLTTLMQRRGILTAISELPSDENRAVGA